MCPCTVPEWQITLLKTFIYHTLGSYNWHTFHLATAIHGLLAWLSHSLTSYNYWKSTIWVCRLVERSMYVTYEITSFHWCNHLLDYKCRPLLEATSSHSGIATVLQCGSFRVFGHNNRLCLHTYKVFFGGQICRRSVSVHPIFDKPFTELIFFPIPSLGCAAFLKKVIFCKWHLGDYVTSWKKHSFACLYHLKLLSNVVYLQASPSGPVEQGCCIILWTDIEGRNMHHCLPV